MVNFDLTSKSRILEVPSLPEKGTISYFDSPSNIFFNINADFL